ncbi:hypothetical protein V8F33_000947 [Rhypophila sp. PSN 637]
MSIASGEAEPGNASHVRVPNSSSSHLRFTASQQATRTHPLLNSQLQILRDIKPQHNKPKMPELLIQSSKTVSRDKKLAAEVSQIRQNCKTDHSEKTLVECPDCYAKVLEAFRIRYLESPDDEWFKSRGGHMLQELDKMIAKAKEYQLSPADIDEQMKEEQAKWYVEQARAMVLTLMVDDLVDNLAGRDAVLEELYEPPYDLTTIQQKTAALVFKNKYMRNVDVASISDRLASASDRGSQLKVLKEAFFTPPPGSDLPKAPYDEYYKQLKYKKLSMDQVMERVMEDRQSAIGKHTQAEKLKGRLADLKRARAAHELEKKKKAKTLANSVKNSVPDELYNLPPCAAACGQTPSTEEFPCCIVCDILVTNGVQEQRTVYCSSECREKAYDDHVEATHACSAGDNCIQLQEQDEDAITEDDSFPEGMSSSTAHFCSECLTSLKQPTLWCSAECAAHDFQQHRENVHLPERKKLKLDVAADKDQLVYDEQTGDKESSYLSPKKTYHAKDIKSHLISFDEALRDWEKQNGVEMIM